MIDLGNQHIPAPATDIDLGGRGHWTTWSNQGQFQGPCLECWDRNVYSLLLDVNKEAYSPVEVSN